jgi:hypothetical protein
MKKLVYPIFLIASVFGVLILSNCSDSDDDDGDDPVDKLEVQLNKLKNDGTPWVLGAGGVEKDGYDVTDQFTGFKLSIGAYTYQTQNSLASAWHASGTWAFSNNQIELIERDDGILIQVYISGNNLVLSFDTPTGEGGRIKDVPGSYTFNLQSE